VGLSMYMCIDVRRSQSKYIDSASSIVALNEINVH